MSSVIPVDTARFGAMTALGVEPAVDNDGAQRMRDGVPVWRIETLIQPPARPDGGRPRRVIELVSVPAVTEPKISPMAAVTYDGLTARMWEMNGRSGVAFSAQAVHAGKGAE